MARYRVHSGGNWSARDRTSQLEEDLLVYERLLDELPERGPLLERCVENRHCQIVVEETGVPGEAVVALGDAGADMPVYFNGRHAARLRLDGSSGDADAAQRLCEVVSGGPRGADRDLHYRPRVPPREPTRDDRLHIVMPRSVDGALEADGSLAALLAREGELVWSDEWCRIWEAEVNCSAAPSQERGTDDMGALLEISDVSLVEPLPAELRGRFLDEPKRGAVLDARAVDLLGWVLGEESKAVAVELTLGGSVFWRTPVQIERPDVAEVFPDRAEAGRAGFKATLNLIGADRVVELGVQAVLAGQRRVPLAKIEARRRWRRDRSPEFSQLVSVVIPCAGHAHYLGEAIESVLAQTYPHLEVVVVDDGSPDNASAITSRYAGVRRLQTDGEGVSVARNAGLRNTNGDFLVFLDADDRLLSDAIEVGLRKLEEHPECAAAIGAYLRTSHDGKPIDTHDQPAVEEEQYAALMRNNWAGFPGRAIYRRAVFEHVRGFDPGLKAAEDFALNLEIMRRFPVCSHEVVVVEHREHNRNSSADAAMMLTETLVALKAQRAAVKRDPRLKAAYRKGRRHMKAYYGDLLAVQVRDSLRERHPGKALREAMLLARHHPPGLVHVLSSSPPPATL
jgi:glycosyltransferase involved in cell wall biosynthesis